jgi:hypothetical protein
MVPVAAYAYAALEECRRSADFMTGPNRIKFLINYINGMCSAWLIYIRLLFCNVT